MSTGGLVKELKLAVEQFYQALNQMFQGDASLMNEVWSHAEDVSYLGPQGVILHGWKGIFANWEKQANMHLGGKIRLEDEQIFFSDQMAIHQGWEIGENTLNGKKTSVRLRVTNVFRKEGDAWKMITHQTDTIPELMKRVG